ncbi:TrbI/VirB10 family protein [Brevundimonas nasdae]|uniref:TrbI/VirB10 family protein n=1 Tax=Brevundimonas nasdae TaxID=172043 RepID=A0ABX8TJJ8_9CAUL|nr:TrbI/VirB10 family protein [Brevundimonas nasdae]QYC09329.1 TrbI/VirB10 family protein [Brevundimonas nasdae]QYC15377.1 TrbI/VirB10 family protein [Brevundimonas nasdae]
MIAALLVSGSLAWAFIIQPKLTSQARDAANEIRPDAPRGGVRPSERVTDQPATYDRLPPPRVFGARDEGRSQIDASPSDPAISPVAHTANSGAPAAPRPGALAAASGLFFPEGGAARPPSAPAAAAAALATVGPSATARDYGTIYSPHELIAPVSPYELKAGAIVPGALLTAVDTGRAGPVLATVTQNIFDSISGRHLVIPQGTRLLGRYEGDSAYGDRRAFLVWDRMILPNGKSLLLAQEQGVDAQGAVGVRGQVDRRLGSLGIASLFAGAISTIGELARGRSDDRSVVASAGDAASIEAAQVGGRLIDRELAVRPSIRVEAGTPVSVMITRDLILEPYIR